MNFNQFVNENEIDLIGVSIVISKGFEPPLAPSLTDGFGTKPLYAT